MNTKLHPKVGQTILLVALILICAVLCIWRAVRILPDREIFVGEVTYIEIQEEFKWDFCYLYAKPIDGSGREDWVRFKITADSIPNFSGDLSFIGSMDIKVGATVTIAFDKKSAKENYGYYLVSTISAGETARATDSLEPVYNKGYEDIDITGSASCNGTLLHSVRVDSPKGGYLIYVLNTTTNRVQQFWVADGENTILSDGVDQKLLNGETNYPVSIEYFNVNGYEYYPLVKWVMSK